MKNNDILASVVLLVENINNEITDFNIKKIFDQTWENIELYVFHRKEADFSNLKEKYSTFPANIFWIEYDDLIKVLNSINEVVSGQFVFYKTLGTIDWYPRHIEHHLECFEDFKFKGKWSYSMIELKNTDREPINNLGWRIEFPRQDQFLLDEFVHSTDLKIDWNQCVKNDNGNLIFIPGLILNQLRNNRFVNPSEITIRFTIAQQNNVNQQQIIGQPQSNDIKENIEEINGELEIIKSYPTIVGNVQFSDRNKNILQNIDNDKIFKIAIKRSMGLGDVILIEPVIRALKTKYKNAKITLFTTNYSSSDKIAELFPELDSITIIGQDNLLKDYLSSIDGFNLKFDLDLAYESRLNTRYIDSYLDVCGFYENIEEVNGELKITRGFDDEFLIPKLNYKVDKIIKDKYVTFTPEGSGWGGKEWNINNWKNIIDSLIKKGYKVVFTSNIYKDIINGDNIIHNQDNDFGLLLNYICHSTAHFGSDSGPMHIATSFKKPVFVISGAALSKYTTAYNIFSVYKENLECLGCKHKFFYSIQNNGLTFVPPCSNTKQYDCMNGLTIDYVLNKFDEFSKMYNL